jgi:hypothetical protein
MTRPPRPPRPARARKKAAEEVSSAQLPVSSPASPAEVSSAQFQVASSSPTSPTPEASQTLAPGRPPPPTLAHPGSTSPNNQPDPAGVAVDISTIRQQIKTYVNLQWGKTQPANGAAGFPDSIAIPVWCAIKSACRHIAGAEERWADRRKTGLTDEQLLEALGRELGIQGGASGGGGILEINYTGRGSPRIWIGPYECKDKPTLSGPALLRAVRDVLLIRTPEEVAKFRFPVSRPAPPTPEAGRHLLIDSVTVGASADTSHQSLSPSVPVSLPESPSRNSKLETDHSPRSLPPIPLHRSAPTLEYAAFLHRKTQLGPGQGFEPLWIPDFLFDFQKHLTRWAILQGRAGLFEDCGLGKSVQELVIAENVARFADGRVLIFTPLAVAAQMQREAEKFGIEARVCRDGNLPKGIRLIITNYERLHYFDPADFIGAIGDESGAIKAFDGKLRKKVVRFFAKLRYRLTATATPSPNDFIELGCQSECLGVMTQSEMLSYFFRQTENMRHTVFKEGDFWNRTKWTFKPHSEQPFWRWVSSWARAIRSPADLGYCDAGFRLPPLNYHRHVLDIPHVPPGELYHRPAVSLQEQKDERKRTVAQRCDHVAALLNSAAAGNEPAIAWCHLNAEGLDLARRIDGAVEVAGRHDDDFKEAALNDFALGNIRVLVTKPKIGCWGMNYQHCHRMSFFPTYSFEQFYQGVRRCWRFGQSNQVDVHIVSAEGESRVMDGLDLKCQQNIAMFDALVRYMNDAMAMHGEDRHHQDLALPQWLQERDKGTEGQRDKGNASPEAATSARSVPVGPKADSSPLSLSPLIPQSLSSKD